jgi:preflagellin peptidase FlaK
MIFTLLALSGAIVASYTDLKHGIIQNKLTLSLFTVGFLGHLILEGRAIVTSLFSSVFLIFIMGYGFWMVGGWSAGDAKEFLFLAALLPQYPPYLKSFFHPQIGPYPFILTVFINTFLAIFPFILLWGIYLSYKRAKLIEFLEPVKNFEDIGAKAAFFTAAILLSVLLGVSVIYIVPLIFISYKLGKRVKMAVSIITFLIFVIQTSELFFIFKNIIAVFLAIMTFNLFWNSIQVVRKQALQRTVNIKDLEAGMVPSEEIYIGESKIETRASGLTREDVRKLKELESQGKMKEIRVKMTTPFAPVILIGLLISLTLGDLIMVVRHG